MLHLSQTMGLSLLILALAGAGPLWGQDSNLVVNGGFELDENNNGVPDAWFVVGGTGIKQSITLDEGRKGGRSARLTCTKFAPTSGPAHVMICQVGKVAVKKDQWYRLAFWAKHSGMAVAPIEVGLRNTDGWYPLGLDETFGVGPEWKEYIFLFQSPEDCTETSRLQFWHTHVGSMWLDDVELVAVEGETRAPAHVIAPKGSKNLVPNSSFECGADSWGSVTLLPLSWNGGPGELIGQIDPSQAVHGTSSMKIELTPETTPMYDIDYYEVSRTALKAPLLGTVGWSPVEKEQVYTVSAYLKADRDGVVALLGMWHFPKDYTTETVKVSTSWQRYAVQVKAHCDYAHVLVGPDLQASGLDAATLWVDDVQMEKGVKATEYESLRCVETGLSTAKTGNVFLKGEPVVVTVFIHNISQESENVSCNLTVSDFFDKKAARKSATIPAPSGTAQRREIDLGLTKTGFYRLHATMQWSEGRAEQELRMAVIPGYEAKDSIIGMNHAYGRPHLLKLCKAAGLTWFRDWSLKWEHVEPQKGVFDFSATDTEIDRIVAEGLNVLALLPFPSAEWSSTAPADRPRTRRGKRIRSVSYAPRDEAEFQNYVMHTVRHYKDRIHHWQIFNEPLTTNYSLPRRAGYESKDYARWLKVASQAARAVDPHCKMLAGFAGPVPREFEGLFKAGAMDAVDIITVHRYPKVTPPEHVEALLRSVNQVMERYGRRKPIWITEHGYYGDDDPEAVPPPFNTCTSPLPSEQVQAEYSIRFNVTSMANGVEKIFYHSGQCTRINRDSIEGIFFEFGGAPRKIYPAAAAFTHMLCPDATFVKKLEHPDEIRTYLFRRGDRHILVAWDPTASGKHALQLLDARMQAHDIMGNPLPDRATVLTASPVYIAASGMSVPEIEGGMKIESRLP